MALAEMWRLMAPLVKLVQMGLQQLRLLLPWLPLPAGQCAWL